MAAPQNEFDRLDQAIEEMKGALWNYRYARQELEMDLSGRQNWVMSEDDRTRFSLIAARLVEAARHVQTEADLVQRNLTRS
jgi:hypothetical protein